ncbi:hypothetical protein GCM10010371_33950 [Streptomyces subrutilus]|uniref:Uncharacterized protein n=1 Tax=Streptomyces subrutilus TaxID=36818 RepID=A0A918QTE3_9ACTN|nr:hypothetical protein GCM10010371_33950 [Streptomyces subrutilus]
MTTTRAPLSSSRWASSALGAPGVQRHADRARPGDGEQALDRLDPVAEQDRRPLVPHRAEPRQVTRQPPGPALQLPVGQPGAAVFEGDLLPDAPGVLPQQLREGPDDVRVHTHLFTTS